MLSVTTESHTSNICPPDSLGHLPCFSETDFYLQLFLRNNTQKYHYAAPLAEGQISVLKDNAEGSHKLVTAAPTSHFTAENLSKFDIAAEQQRDHLAKDAHTALVSCYKHPTSNQPRIDFQALHT